MLPRQHSSRRRDGSRRLRPGGVLGAIALGSALAIAAPLPALAAPTSVPQSYAEGRFLSGSLLGSDLSRLLDVASAEAQNDGTQPTQTVKDPLAVTALQAVTVGSGESLRLSLGEVLQLGAVSQYAQAAQEGVSVAASGAIADDGGIAIGAARTAPGGSTTLELSKLLGPGFAASLADLRLSADAVSARADGKRDVAVGDYSIAGLTLRLSSPAVARLTEKVDSALTVVTDEVAELTGDRGRLLQTVSGVVDDLDPALGLLGSSAKVAVTIDTSGLREAVHEVLQARYSDQGVSFDLESGAIVIDLAKYVGGLNDRPANSELLSAAVVDDILDNVLDTVTGLADEVVVTVERALRDLEVRISARVSVDIAQAPVVEEVCRTVERIVRVPVAPGEGSGGSGSGGGGLLGGLLGGVGEIVGGVVGTVTDPALGFVDKLVRELVCERVERAVDPLTTSIDLEIAATVDELVRGVGVDAKATARVLGAPVALDTQLLIGRVGNLLSSTLLSDGTITELVKALDARLVDPALTGLLGDGSSVRTALAQLLSITVNVQERSSGGGDRVPGSYFTQTALRISVLDGRAATVNLASATVGPDAVSDIDAPEPPGGPEDPDTPGSPNDPDDTSSTPTGLAHTGLSLAGILALVIGLLTLGAALLQAHRRRAALEAVGELEP